ncbi:MAG TPA: VOC family protein [Deltaproteobacteria bacterium]|nr:VOC family protein [Deltaproteobacteria bacterium]
MIKSFLHVGVGVKDLDESVRFYTEVLEMEEEYRAHNEGEKISRIVDVENADFDFCILTKNNLKVELLAYKSANPNDRQSPIRQDSIGLIHLAFQVDDVDKEYERIKALGYPFNAPPMVARENGPKITYFTGPDNVIIEIYQKMS